MASNMEEIREFLTRNFSIPLEQKAEDGRFGLLQVSKLMIQQIELGLSGVEGQKSADLKMFPTYVEKLPTGKENGDFLAVDVSGTHLSVMLYRLDGKGGVAYKPTPLVRTIPPEIQRGSNGSVLFDFIVDGVNDFIEGLQLQSNDFPLAFTFSFPCKQLALNSAVLDRWTLGYDCDGVLGKDVAKLLHEARDRKKELNFTFHCVCLVNDNVGCLVAGALNNPSCRLGIVVGSGTNAAYPEPLRNIKALPDSFKTESSHMVVNMEWGSFGQQSKCLSTIQTPYDVALDEQSSNCGEQIYEKMISSLYLGEVFRLVLIDFLQKGWLFQKRGEIPENSKLYQSYQISTRDMIALERNAEALTTVLEFLKKCDVPFEIVSNEDVAIIQAISRALLSRSASLLGAGIAAVLSRLNEGNDDNDERIVVAISGSLVKDNCGYISEVQQIAGKITDSLMSTNKQAKLIYIDDSSGLGSIAVAASAK